MGLPGTVWIPAGRSDSLAPIEGWRISVETERGRWRDEETYFLYVDDSRRRHREGIGRKTPAFYGFPTNVVTLWLPSENVKREPLTEAAGLAARLSADDVTQGVRLHGAAPETNTAS